MTEEDKHTEEGSKPTWGSVNAPSLILPYLIFSSTTKRLLMTLSRPERNTALCLPCPFWLIFLRPPMTSLACSSLSEVVKGAVNPTSVPTQYRLCQLQGRLSCGEVRANPAPCAPWLEAPVPQQTQRGLQNARNVRHSAWESRYAHWNSRRVSFVFLLN